MQKIWNNIRVLRALLICLVIVTIIAACLPDKMQTIQQATGVSPTVTNYVERRNIDWKIAVQDRTNTIQWCTFFSDSGVPLTTQAVLNKMTSGNKRLDPSSTMGTSSFTFRLPGDENIYFTDQVPGADGTFGSSNPYEFGFGPEGVEGYFQTDLKYFCSLKPMTWQAPTVNLGYDESLLSKQLVAQQALQAGQCIDAALNVVACP